MNAAIQISNLPPETPAEFEARFSRCSRLLALVASRVLGGDEGVDEAIENCHATASCNPPRFEYEGTFRRWLLRILVNEALAILREKQAAAGEAINSVGMCTTHRSISIKQSQQRRFNMNVFSKATKRRLMCVAALACMIAAGSISALAAPKDPILRTTTSGETLTGMCCSLWDASIRVFEPHPLVPIVVTWEPTSLFDDRS